MKITKRQLIKIIKEEIGGTNIKSLQPSTKRVASTPEGELRVWLNLIGADNLEKAVKGKEQLINDLVAALREYDALRR